MGLGNQLPLTEATFFIMLSLAPGPKHGYAILKDIQALSEGRIRLSTGTLYGAIRRLLDQGWITAWRPVLNETDRQRGLQLDRAGRRILDAECPLQQLASKAALPADNFMTQSQILFSKGIRTWLAATWLMPAPVVRPHQDVPSLLMQSQLNGVSSLAEWLYQFVRNFPPAWWVLTRLAPAEYWSGPRVVVEAGNRIFALFVLLLALFAWRRDWPRWSATALGYVLIVLFETSLMIWRDDRTTSFSAMVVLIGYVILIVWLTRGDPLAGLLSFLPLYPMFVWWTAMDGVRGIYGEAFYYIFIGSVMALVVADCPAQPGFASACRAVAILPWDWGYATPTQQHARLSCRPEETNTG
jgi:hypothetical protein